jgi:3-hydroxybutyrate dehydrogenase
MAGAGPVDILVNNAGMQHVAPVEEFPVDKWDKIIALNLTAAFDTSRLAIPHMKQAGWGRIINTASAHSLTASPFKSAYVSAKHGLNGGADQDAGAGTGDLRHHRQLHQPRLCLDAAGGKPDPRYHGSARADPRSGDQRCDAGSPADQAFVQPSDIGAMAVFLCREEANNITGSNISMDGGWTAE